MLFSVVNQKRRILQDPRTQRRRRRHNKATPGPWNAFLWKLVLRPRLSRWKDVREDEGWTRSSSILSTKKIFSTNNFATSRAGGRFNCDSSGEEKVPQTLPFSDLIYGSRFLTADFYVFNDTGPSSVGGKKERFDDKRQKIISESH